MNPEYDALRSRGQSLEDAFFAERDRQLMEALRRRLNAEESEKVLAAAVGISEKLALERISKVEAGLPVLAAMALLPPVEVAWCDGEVSAKERDAVLKAASEVGVGVDTPTYQLLQSWLAQRPSPAAVEKWKEYVRAICATLDKDTVAKLRQGVIGRAEKIALAAGGMLGFGNKISSEERACLDDLSQAFSG
jgi:hypothetical protein